MPEVRSTAAFFKHDDGTKRRGGIRPSPLPGRRSFLWGSLVLFGYFIVSKIVYQIGGRLGGFLVSAAPCLCTSNWNASLYVNKSTNYGCVSQKTHKPGGKPLFFLGDRVKLVLKTIFFTCCVVHAISIQNDPLLPVSQQAELLFLRVSRLLCLLSFILRYIAPVITQAQGYTHYNYDQPTSPPPHPNDDLRPPRDTEILPHHLGKTIS
jgi:hypothetical protein